MIKLQGVISKSAEIMGAMNKYVRCCVVYPLIIYSRLVNITEISETMRTMAREMERAS